MNKKQLIELLGGIFVAVIFITSYVSLTNYNSSNKSATTTINAAKVFGVGAANAVIYSYYPSMSIQVSCRNATIANSTITSLSNTLTALENNNSVNNFITVNRKIQVSAGTYDSKTIYDHISSGLPQPSLNCTAFSGAALVTLPQTIKMKVETQSGTISLPPNQRNVTIPINFTQNMSNTIHVKVSALLYLNGTVVGQLQVTKD